MSKLSTGEKILYLAIAAFFLANPYTRRAIFWLLPLGRGIDDLIQLVVIILLVGYLVAQWWIKTDKSEFIRKMNNKRNTKVKQVVWAVGVLVALLVNPITGPLISALLLYGKSTDDVTLFVGAVVSAVLVVGGWKLLSLTSNRS